MQSLADLYERLNRSKADYVPLANFDRHSLECLFACEERHPAGISVSDEDIKNAPSVDVKQVMLLLRESAEPTFAMIAPAFVGQFPRAVTPGKLRTAFKRVGFSGMIEVSLFADILTLKEAFEFDRNILTDEDFLLTSCCCPMWIALIRKSYDRLVPHIPPSVSPMVACGRAIKQVCPGARTVFIGPCLAKKSEAREPDIRDAVDYVLTFEETVQMFRSIEMEPEQCEDDLRDHSSAAGRIYARVGGVSRAVQETVNRIHPGRRIPLRALQANGMRECKAVLNDVLEGKLTANFLEGMGCPGGCVGGPRRLVPVEDGIASVNRYGEKASYRTPIDNPYVIELLRLLGFETVESLLEGENMFTRRFGEREPKVEDKHR